MNIIDIYKTKIEDIQLVNHEGRDVYTCVYIDNNNQKSSILKEQDTYQDKCRTNCSNIKDKDRDKDKNKDRVFKKPTLDNIRDYCISRNNNINPEQFYDYYEANGWKINRNPMKDWKATVRNWERNEFNRKSTDNFGLPIIEEPW